MYIGDPIGSQAYRSLTRHVFCIDIGKPAVRKKNRPTQRKTSPKDEYILQAEWPPIPAPAPADCPITAPVADGTAMIASGATSPGVDVDRLLSFVQQRVLDLYSLAKVPENPMDQSQNFNFEALPQEVSQRFKGKLSLHSQTWMTGVSIMFSVSTVRVLIDCIVCV